ncbi:MAG: MlaD family protein [Bacteroidales bacterium]|nr:MlaD family protein [Bacteroidales bacterium]
MSHTLSRAQAIILGLVVFFALGLSGLGLSQIGTHRGYWSNSFEMTAGFPEVHDIAPGTPVRIRGVNAGQVIAVEYPQSDEPTANVIIRMRIDARFTDRIFSDGSASLQPTGLLGSKIVAIHPGHPTAGILETGHLRAVSAADFAQTAAKLDMIATKLAATIDETTLLVQEIRTGNGTLPKLLRDEELYAELKNLSHDTRTVLKRADGALETVEIETANVRGLVQDGRDTLRSVRQGTDALQRMPIIRSYVENEVTLLARPDCRREALTFPTADLFEPNSAILTDRGKERLQTVTAWLKDGKADNAEVVVVSQCDPQNTSQTAASAGELTRKQSSAAIEYLKEQGAHKIGWFARRTMTPLGLGFGPAPVPVPESVPSSYLQVLVFTPQQ